MRKLTKEQKKSYIAHGLTKEYLDKYYGFNGTFHGRYGRYWVIYYLIYYGSLKKFVANSESITKNHPSWHSNYKPVSAYSLEFGRKILVKNKEFKLANQLKKYIEKIKLIELMVG